MSIEVLEEALRIESVLADKLSEVGNNCCNGGPLLIICLSSSVNSLSSSITDNGFVVLLETLLSEYFVNKVTEVSPPDVVTSLWSLEVRADHVELLSTDWDLGHVEADAELGGRDVARSESVEVSEEFANADALLLAGLTKS